MNDVVTAATGASTPGAALRLARTLKSKYEQAFRLIALHYLSGRVPYHLVTEFPKSGGTWLGQLLSAYGELPFPRNEAPRLVESILHGHYLPNQRMKSLRSVLWLVRDGRDVIVSHYHHLLIWNERNVKQPKEVLYHRKKLRFRDYDDVATNLPAFVEFMFTDRPSKLHRFTYMGNWASFNTAWLNQDYLPDERVVRARYEDLLNDTAAELARIVAETFGEPAHLAKVRKIAEAYSFERQAGRSRGEEKKTSFLRKGIAGDWKNYFSPETARVFDHYAGTTLVQLGYEPDRSWVERVS